MAGFDYKANTLAIANVLTNANTTTAAVDLSGGLTTRVKNVYRNDPEVVDMRGDVYPAVFVRINRKEEDFEGLGVTGTNGAFKKAVATYDIIGFYRKDGANSAHANVLLELEVLAKNIEAVLQNEMTLSGTALWCQPVNTEFIGPYGGDNMWIKGIRVELSARYHFR